MELLCWAGSQLFMLANFISKLTLATFAFFSGEEGRTETGLSLEEKKSDNKKLSINNTIGTNYYIEPL